MSHPQTVCPVCSRSYFLCSDQALPLKNCQEVRAEFKAHGITVSQWAAEHHVHMGSVYEVIKGRKACIRGHAHVIAVLLRIKRGDITEFLARHSQQAAAAQ